MTEVERLTKEFLETLNETQMLLYQRLLSAMLLEKVKEYT